MYGMNFGLIEWVLGVWIVLEGCFEYYFKEMEMYFVNCGNIFFIFFKELNIL